MLFFFDYNLESASGFGQGATWVLTSLGGIGEIRPDGHLNSELSWQKSVLLRRQKTSILSHIQIYIGCTQQEINKTHLVNSSWILSEFFFHISRVRTEYGSLILWHRTGRYILCQRLSNVSVTCHFSLDAHPIWFHLMAKTKGHTSRSVSAS